MDKSKNIALIDALKAIGIILVVIGHNDTILTKYIYSFHMPLFFLISGITFNDIKWTSFDKFIKSRIKSLLIPYFKYSIILFIIWIPLDIIKGVEINKHIILRNLYGIFYSQGALNYMAWGVPMWFLTCLFLISIGYFFINKYLKNYRFEILVLCIFIGYLTKFLPYRMPWSLDCAFIGIVFYGIGHIYRKKILEFKFDTKIRKNKIILVLLTIILINLNNVNGRVDFYSNKFNNYIIFFICSFVGIMILLLIGKNIENVKVLEILKFLSKNTVIILAFHIRVLDGIKFFVMKIFNLNVNFNNLILGVIILPLIQISVILYTSILIKKIRRFIEMKNRDKDKEIYYYQ